MTTKDRDTIDPCSVCGADGDPRHLIADWAYCTPCGEAFDREIEAYCTEEPK